MTLAEPDDTWLEIGMTEPESYIVMEDGRPAVVHMAPGVTVLDMDLLRDDPETSDSALVERLYDRLRALQSQGEPVYEQMRQARSWLDAHTLAFAPEALEDQTDEDG